MNDTTCEDVIAHYGVKGMQWGVRKKSGGRLTGTPKKAKGKPTVSEDAAAVSKARAKAKDKGLPSLSNKEIKAVNTRLDMETKYKSLTKNTGLLVAGAAVVGGILANVGKQQASRLANEAIVKALKKEIVDEVTK